MGAFVPCATNPPPVGKTVMVRFGQSVCFAAFSSWLNKWFLIAPGTEEEIAAPTLWWDPDATKDESEQAQVVAAQESTRLRKRRGLQQAQFVFGQSDSQTLSNAGREAAGASGGARKAESA